jgi:hypothetical protein
MLANIIPKLCRSEMFGLAIVNTYLGRGIPAHRVDRRLSSEGRASGDCRIAHSWRRGGL